jgi:hypothetical protein
MAIVISVFVERSTWGHCGLLIDAGPPRLHTFDFEKDTHERPRHTELRAPPANATLHPVAQAAPPLLDAIHDVLGGLPMGRYNVLTLNCRDYVVRGLRALQDRLGVASDPVALERALTEAAGNTRVAQVAGLGGRVGMLGRVVTGVVDHRVRGYVRRGSGADKERGRGRGRSGSTESSSDDDYPQPVPGNYHYHPQSERHYMGGGGNLPRFR